MPRDGRCFHSAEEYTAEFEKGRRHSLIDTQFQEGTDRLTKDRVRVSMNFSISGDDDYSDFGGLPSEGGTLEDLLQSSSEMQKLWAGDLSHKTS